MTHLPGWLIYLLALLAIACVSVEMKRKGRT
jgi:hypothetical protein